MVNIKHNGRIPIRTLHLKHVPIARSNAPQGAGIGDIFLSSAVVNHDRRIPIPGFDVYGVGRFECPPCPNLQVCCLGG